MAGEKHDLIRLIEEYERIVYMLEEIQKQILTLLSEIPIASQLRSIKGIGPIFVAAILDGAGDHRHMHMGVNYSEKPTLIWPKARRENEGDDCYIETHGFHITQIYVSRYHTAHRSQSCLSRTT
ncbi:hypothetical protein ACI7RC_18310 [Brevibacillus sp. B_LB10_24]|uniref:hypothetical protein n=1 Tax=Brevibacillus sp. B_LB10_24 TaxID=3380645 RepID=UPI0038B9F007